MGDELCCTTLLIFSLFFFFDGRRERRKVLVSGLYFLRGNSATRHDRKLTVVRSYAHARIFRSRWRYGDSAVNINILDLRRAKRMGTLGAWFLLRQWRHVFFQCVISRNVFQRMHLRTNVFFRMSFSRMSERARTLAQWTLGGWFWHGFKRHRLPISWRRKETLSNIHPPIRGGCMDDFASRNHICKLSLGKVTEASTSVGLKSARPVTFAPKV
jgi:hypothetical protein